MKPRQMFRVILAANLLATAFIGCDTNPIVEPPLPPVPIPDCSYNLTTTVTDTSGIPPTSTNISTQFSFYEGYRVNSICISPNDPNFWAIVLDDIDMSVLPITWKSVLVIVDICDGVSNIIHSTAGSIIDVDWGNNDVLIFSQASFDESIYTIKPDGTNLTLIPYSSWTRNQVKWSPDALSFLISSYATPKVSHVNINGQLLSEDIGIEAWDIDFLADGRIAYINRWGVGIYDQTNGDQIVLDEFDLPSFEYNVAYSEKYNALLWSTDSITALTDIETGQRTELVLRGEITKWNYGAAVSKNGYLAYMSRVVSLALSTADEWKARSTIRLINKDGTDERRLVLDFQ